MSSNGEKNEALVKAVKESGKPIGEIVYGICSEATLHRWMRGETKPRLLDARRIATRLKREPQELWPRG